MAPKARTKNTGWPKYVTVVNKRYVIYRPRIPAEQQHIHPIDKHGFLKPAIKLGKTSDPHEAILRRYLAAKAELDAARESGLNTLSWLSSRYQESRQFKELAPSTQKHYQAAAKVLDHPIKKRNKDATLGDLLATEMSKPIMQAVVEKRLADMKARKLKGEAAVNYESRYVSSMLAWGCNYVPEIGITDNPLRGLKRVKEPRNTRYVTDTEYNIQRNIAGGYLPIYFELAYLCAGRKGEVRELRESDVLDEGLRLRRTKGSKHNIVLWTPRLRAAVDAARAMRVQPKIVKLGDDPTLLTDRNGQKISDEGVKSAMSRLKKTMVEEGLGDTFWSLHLLKHKGMTDAENKDLGGHKNQAIKDSYNHELDKIKPVK